MRRLPSLDTLRAFEAAARHLSFTKAAAELHVTQSALSQRVATLEDELGFALFERRARKLILTPRGRFLAAAMGRALAELAGAFERFEEGFGARRLALSVLPSFAARWLLPRLPQFHAEHPETEVAVSADAKAVDLRSSEIDVAIRFGAGRYPGMKTEFVMDDYVVPVCRPDLLPDGAALAGAAALADFPLLHDVTTETDVSGSDWRRWFAFAGVPGEPRPGPRFNQGDLVLQAAAQGTGAALARLSLVADDLSAGRLAVMLNRPLRTRWDYYAVSLPAKAARPAVAAFRQWLLREARAFVARRGAIGSGQMTL